MTDCKTYSRYGLRKKSPFYSLLFRYRVWLYCLNKNWSFLIHYSLLQFHIVVYGDILKNPRCILDYQSQLMNSEPESYHDSVFSVYGECAAYIKYMCSLVDQKPWRKWRKWISSVTQCFSIIKVIPGLWPPRWNYVPAAFQCKMAPKPSRRIILCSSLNTLSMWLQISVEFTIPFYSTLN